MASGIMKSIIDGLNKFIVHLIWENIINKGALVGSGLHGDKGYIVLGDHNIDNWYTLELYTSIIMGK